MPTIGAAERFGLLVSTTHVLSSGVVGAMTAEGPGMETGTIRDIVLARVLALPGAMLSGSLPRLRPPRLRPVC